MLPAFSLFFKSFPPHPSTPKPHSWVYVVSPEDLSNLQLTHGNLQSHIFNCVIVDCVQNLSYEWALKSWFSGFYNQIS